MDGNTGLNDAQQRYYDPEVGRFLSVDPVGVSVAPGANFNLYHYANNNPYRFVDPDGREPDCATQACNLEASAAPQDRKGPTDAKSLQRESIVSIDGLVGQALTDDEIGNIVFNETRSLSGEGIEAARRDIAHTIINADESWGNSRDLHAGTAPTTMPKVFSQAIEGGTLDAIRMTVEGVRMERGAGVDPTEGATNFNLRTHPGTSPPSWAATFESRPFTAHSRIQSDLNNTYISGRTRTAGGHDASAENHRIGHHLLSRKCSRT